MARRGGFVCVFLVLACGGRSTRTDESRTGSGGSVGDAGGPVASSGAVANAPAAGGAPSAGGSRGSGASAGHAGATAGAPGANGGRSGRGAGGDTSAGRENDAGARDCGELIDDMEDGSGRICTGSGRVGVWYSFNDDLGTQTPAATIPGTPIAVSPIPGGRDASEYAIHTYGDGFTAWGAGVGLDLAYDGTTYATYDATAYSGISFWVRGKGQRPHGQDLTGFLYLAAVTPTLSFRTSDEISTYHDWGGTSMVKSFGPSVGIEVEDEWTQHFVPFRNLSQRVGTFEPDRLTNLQFLTRVMPFDFWVDDIAFYSGVANCCSPGCGDTVSFADPNLAQRVSNSAGVSIPLGTYDVSCETVCTATTFTSTYVPLTSLAGLECVAPLAAAVLNGSSLHDVAPLARLPHLGALDISTNSVVDLAPLATLEELHSLDVSNNPLPSLAPLAAAPRLAFLRANAANLSVVELDGGFGALESLEINTNPLTSLALVNLPRLTYLDASGGKLHGLALDLPGLTKVRLDGNPLATLELETPLLDELDARDTLLTDLNALRGARSLTQLALDDCPLVDIAALAELPALNVISLVHTPVVSAALGAIKGGPVGYLGLTGTAVDDISALEHVAFGPQANGLPLVIALDSTGVTDLSPLVRNPTVVSGTVYIGGTPLDCAAQAENIASLAARGVAVTGLCLVPP